MLRKAECLLMTMMALAFTGATAGQAWASPEQAAYVDESGVLRWQASDNEVALFGVNYTAMFAFGFRALGYLGVSREQTITHDLVHLARLGVDGVRLCLWGDWELTDGEGNLLDNEHLRLTDYFIAQAQARGMHILLTPIVTYSAQWPEPESDRVCAGFSTVYSKAELPTSMEARQAQERYLGQLMEHINPYTGQAYKDEPAITAIELINEPANPTSQEQIRAYVEGLAKAVRDTGCRKPLFYNVSQGMWDALINALRESSVEGVTFGWYPTGLLAGHSVRGNFLPKVDEYPQMRDAGLAGKAKLVYEFDAADVPGSYMYPAIARTFRAGGAQWATMFSYDSLPLAPSNAEYQTHYLNLVHTPNGAISLLIAGEAFRRLPRAASYGRYPQNTCFGPFRISYEEDLSEMVTEREFLYSNDTGTQPLAPELLERVVGCGSSPVVSYEGTGSYFLEKLGAGVWRLEVYPDAVWVRDPYGRPCLDREVSRVLWRRWPMEIRLPALGQRFGVAALNEGNSYRAESTDGTFPIQPGVYLLVREGASASKWSAESPFGQLKLGEFVAPAEEKRPTAVLHEPPREVVEGEPFTVAATVVSSQMPERVTLHLRQSGEGSFRHLPMRREFGYRWRVDVPTELVGPGELEYCIAVQLGDDVRTYPADVGGEPGEEGFAWPEPQVVYAPEQGETPPVVQHRGPQTGGATAEVVQGSQPSTHALRITASALGENSSAAVELRLAVEGEPSREWRGDTAVVVRARGETPSTTARVELVERGGVVYASDLPLVPAWHDWRLPLRDFMPSQGSQVKRQVDLARLGSVRVSLSPAGPAGQGAPVTEYDLQVESVALEPMSALWRIGSVAATDPIVILDPEGDRGNLERRAMWGYHERLVPGGRQGSLALGIGVEGFGRWLWEVSCRHWFRDRVRRRGEPASVFDTLRLVIRAGAEGTNAVQLALTDASGSAWGTVIPLTRDWQEVRLRLAALRPVYPPEVPHPWPVPPGEPERTQVDRGLLAGELDALQISFGPGLFPDQGEKAGAVELGEVALEISHHARAPGGGQAGP